LFNLGGDLVGIINQAGRIESISNYTPVINSLLKEGKFIRPQLGVNYVDLSSLVSPESQVYDKGAIVSKDQNGIAIVKKSPADLAGLKEGDIIISINDIELNSNNNLSSVISQYNAGEEVKIIYERNGERKEVKVKLGEVK
jgi:serine protease Do